MRTLRSAALLGLLALTAPAAAQDRPSEDELFGAPSPPAETTPSTPEPAPAAEPEPGREAALEPEPGALDRLAERVASTDTLSVGGQLYLRAFTFARRGDAMDAWTFAAPSLLDVYLDARPNDRVRAFVLARAQHDPTVEEGAPAQVPLPGADGEADPSQPLPIPGFESSDRTEVLLDQAWLRFDAGRRAFFTVGKQHVKWGVGRFWNPTDFLHVSPRNPLATFDARTGTTMARVHVPWEERGVSFQAAAIFEPLLPARDPGAPASTELGSVGGAARAEAVIGTAELGVGGVVQKGRPSRIGLDVSAGVWELDVYGELALRTDPKRRVWREVDPSLPLLSRFAEVDPSGWDAAATVGASWSWKYSDEDALTVGGEYAWERNGYDDPDIYPWLLLQGDFVPFRVGRHYAGAFVTLPAPGRWNDTTFTLSTLGNLSDRSFVSRLDWSVLVLTYLRVEAFGAVHFGDDRGEFRLGIDVPPIPVGDGRTTPAVRVGPPAVDLGVALRVAL